MEGLRFVGGDHVAVGGDLEELLFPLLVLALRRQPELRALTLKRIFSHKTLYIGEGELIVGEKGTDPQSAPTFPELCCHTLEDMRNMNDRAVVNFTVTDP